MRPAHHPVTSKLNPIVASRCLLLAALALALIGCGEESPPTPVAIATGDSCAFCRQAIAEKDRRFAAEFVTKDRFVRKFCDISCMVQHATTKVKKENVIAWFVADYASGEWVKGEDAVYVRSERFQTPRNGGILAYRDRSSAEALASQFQAQVIGFQELIK